MIGFHTARGMKENARKGFFNGSRPPYGYRVKKAADDRGNQKGVLVPDKEESKQVKRIFQIYTKENQGAVEIAKTLNRDGMFRRVQNKQFEDELGLRTTIKELPASLSSPEHIAFIRGLIKEIRKALADIERPVREVRKQLEDVNARLAKYYEAFEQGRLEPEFVRERTGSLKEQKKALEMELERIRAPKALPPHLSKLENIKKIQQSLRDTFLNGTPGLIKRYLGIILKEVVINGDEVTITGQTAGVIALLDTSENEKSTPSGFSSLAITY